MSQAPLKTITSVLEFPKRPDPPIDRFTALGDLLCLIGVSLGGLDLIGTELVPIWVSVSLIFVGFISILQPFARH